MSFSSGTFSINSSGQPVVTGTVISSTAFNAFTADIATGLSTCVLKDGTQVLTANIPMANFKLTGLGAGSALTDSASITQLQNHFGSYLTSVAGTNTVTGTATPTPAYAIGQRFTFIPAVTNTGATTLNISSVGAGAVQWAGIALVGGELAAGYPTTVVVTATTPVFQIVSATNLKTITNSLSGDVALNDVGLYFTGPSVAQGTSGYWFFSGTVTVFDATAVGDFNFKLWDGTTVIASCAARSVGANQFLSVSLSGALANAAANVKISVKDNTSTSGTMSFNASGNSKDSTLTAIRIG